MPRDPSAWNDGIENACNLEDRNGFKCQLKHQANPALIVKAIKYACNTTGMSVPYCYQARRHEPTRCARRKPKAPCPAAMLHAARARALGVAAARVAHARPHGARAPPGDAAPGRGLPAAARVQDSDAVLAHPPPGRRDVRF